MYASAFGLQQAPFSIAPDPRYLFMSERHREALAHLLYGLRAGGGFVLLTGEIGTGKTTVCRCFLEQMPTDCDVAYVFNPKQSALELLRTIDDEFGVAHAPAAPGAAETIKDCIDPLNRFLLASHAAGRHAVLVIDEAQNLSVDVLEQLRLLTNLETAERKLLQIVLIGQPELRNLLAQPALEQLAQRVVARFHLDALSLPETQAYVAHRLAVAGWQGAPLFDRRALRAIHRRTGGVPRRINLLCDRALLGAYAAGVRSVDATLVQKAAREVFYTAPGGAASSAGAYPPPGTAARRGWAGGAVALAGVALVIVAGAAVWANRPAHLLAELPALPGAVASALSAKEGHPAASSTTQAPAAALDVDTALPQWPATEDAALRALGAAWGVDAAAAPAGPACAALARGDLQCFRARRAGLDLLRQLDRPAVLPLELPPAGTAAGGGKRAAYVLLRGLEADTAWIDVGGTPQRIATAVLARWWRGDLITLWRSAGESPAEMDARLAKVLPDLPADLPRSERITRFQLAQGLPPDGRAGPLTAMRLNRASGVDEPRLARP